jgi:hypothetical protein
MADLGSAATVNSFACTFKSDFQAERNLLVTEVEILL